MQGLLQQEKPMAHTMRKWRNAAGVSPATVSRVLNKTHLHFAETEKRVLKTVNELGYYKKCPCESGWQQAKAIIRACNFRDSKPYFLKYRGFQAAAWTEDSMSWLFNTGVQRTAHTVCDWKSGAKRRSWSRYRDVLYR